MTDVAGISQQIWDMKYRLKAADGSPVDKTIEDTWRRVARALAAVETDPARWEAEFYSAMEDFRFLPAGRIVAGAGTKRHVTLFNCFVMGAIPDDMSGIFEHLKEAALTMQQGGGIGYDFSTLRPRGAPVRGVGADASGPLSFMDVWDAMCRTIMSAGFRRGAMMATLRCDHPDIEAFIEAKREPGRLRMFNLSVLVTDAFMEAIKEGRSWQLHFEGTVYKTVAARDLWDRIMRATYTFAEPGVIFIDRINRRNPLYYCEEIHATNPCGEQPLPPYGACLLGSVNLAKFVRNPFENDAALDLQELERVARIAVRMMDNVTDLSKFPLKAQFEEAQRKRRIGLGVTGLADALIMCRERYGSAQSLRLAETWMKAVQRATYLASAELAAEKGPFPLFDREKYLAGEAIQELEQSVKSEVAAKGLRNALLTSIAPTGTISIFADNVSSGIEPVFAFTHQRSVLMPDGSRREEEVADYAYRQFKRLRGENAPLPDYFVDAQQLSPKDHVAMQAAVQKYVDSSISKTINCPEDLSFAAFKDVYLLAYDLGCKGCTTYRPNPVTGAVLSIRKEQEETRGEQPELPLPKVETAKPRDPFESGGVVYMTRPLDRPEALPGRTYKIRWPESDHAIYITINDIIQDGRRRPFEVFINSKNMDHYAWTVGLTRMISAVFRRGGDVSFVVEELKAVFDPRGGQWVDRKYVPSLLAAIGDVIERHMIDIGFIPNPKEAREGQRELKVVGGSDAEPGEGGGRDAAHAMMRGCPKCGHRALIRQENCDICTSCDYSKCG
ncbi:MAG: adenosylcobalamin-dependent ribonucleoside-diphosphate reductase [Candidatus Odyssella sp.]|nr:adenosylcobalamin-dependent ribonucleoside-diphosphate reductase [Candidatus Odyssella sp.]